MFKLNEDDVRERDYDFLLRKPLPPMPRIDARDRWAWEHALADPSKPVDSDPLALARAEFVNQYPSDGDPLNLSILDKGIEKLLEGSPRTAPPKWTDCRDCGTSLSLASARKSDLCVRCERRRDIESGKLRTWGALDEGDKPRTNEEILLTYIHETANKYELPYHFYRTAKVIECPDGRMRTIRDTASWFRREAGTYAAQEKAGINVDPDMSYEVR